MSQPNGMEELRSELLDEVSSYTTKILTDHGIDDAVAEQSGFALAEFLAEHWGGQLINFPKNHLYKLARRDMQIYNEFNGRNYPQLARKHNMSIRGMYKLIERVHKRRLAETQPDLFS
ncbi:Mor transcription activator family protein [Neptuniibacter marinus]|jgi:Mor family transcriptional regulator|uniref:Mor transcription activator family protein n=1 Tax=Neptuniibacter marinus TaxID=1806670 RepID=UPI003B5C6BD2